MNIYEVFIGNRIIYQGISYQRVMQIFSDITKDMKHKCNYCQHREIYIAKDLSVDSCNHCPDALYKLINPSAMIENDVIEYSQYKCEGIPVTNEKVYVKCTDTDTGKITEIGG